MPAAGFSKGIVKNVLSGDTLVVMGTTGLVPAELQLSLSSLQAPRISHRREAPDEPWAFDSREFLRVLTIGKLVLFRVDYKRTTQSGTERHYGTVMLPQPVGNVSKAVVSAGWARVPRGRDDQPKSPDHEELTSMCDGAEAAARGVFNPDTSHSDVVRSVTHDVDDADASLREWRKAPQTAIVEMVRDGASLRCLLRPSNTVVNFNLAGVQAPRFARRPRPATAAASTSAPSGPDRSKDEPLARESQLFTERRLLAREIQLEFGGVDSYGNFFGRVLHPKGDISAEILKAGMGQVNSRSVTMAPKGQVVALRGAEKAAKAAKLGVWKAYEPRATSGAKAYRARVVEVVSGDSIAVITGRGAAAAEERLFLASLRAPRIGRRGDAPAPFSLEAREALRALLIGREVDVRVCYTRDPSEGATGAAASPRRFVAVRYTTSKGEVKDAGLTLVAAGLAEVIKHRAEEDRADAFDAMLIAEAEATEAGLGLHGKAAQRASKAASVVDVSFNTSAARARIPLLQRAGLLRGVVEHTFGGGRCKVTVPSQKVSFMLALSGVRCPGQARSATTGRDGAKLPARAAEPFGDEAAAYMRQEVNQHDVEVRVEAGDARGTMLGQIWVGTGSEKRFVSVDLLARGLARTIPPVAERSPYKVELFDAEEGARTARMGVWEGYEEAKEAEAAAEAGEEPLFIGRAIDVVDGITFIVHAQRDTASLARVTAAMADLTAKAGTSAAAVDPKKGAVLSALFDDGTGPVWFRARVEAHASASAAAANPGCAAVRASAKAGEAAHRVVYVDYGNEAVVTTAQMRPLPPAVASLPPLARKCRLAFVRAKSPSEDDYGYAAATELSALVMGRDVTMRVHGRDADNSLLVSAFREGDDEAIAETILRLGLIRISKRSLRDIRRRAASGAPGADADRDIVEALAAAQEKARRGRVAQWVSGDIADSDDDM